MRLAQLNANHRPALTRVLTRQSSHNLLLLVLLPRLGIDPEVNMWGLVGQGGLLAVLGRNGSDWSLANPGDAELYPFAHTIETHGPGRLRGEASAVGGVARHLKARIESDRSSLLVRLSPGSLSPEDPSGRSGDILRPLAPGEIADLPRLWPEQGADLAIAIAGADANGGRVLAAFAGSRLAAAAWTEAEAGQLAMIGGVFVPADRRGCGLGSACLWALCRGLLAERKLPQLVYDCPSIGRLASKLGFAPYGRWRQLQLHGGSNPGVRRDGEG